MEFQRQCRCLKTAWEAAVEQLCHVEVTLSINSGVEEGSDTLDLALHSGEPGRLAVAKGVLLLDAFSQAMRQYASKCVVQLDHGGSRVTWKGTIYC